MHDIDKLFHDNNKSLQPQLRGFESLYQILNIVTLPLAFLIYKNKNLLLSTRGTLRKAC